MVRLLFDEQPIIFDRTLAKKIGFTEAIVLQQVNYWVENSKKNNKKYYDGHYWTYNSIKDWQEQFFPFLSIGTVTRVFKTLEENGFLITGNYNKMARDKTKWYTINKEKVDSLIPNNDKNNVLFIDKPIVIDKILSNKIGIKNAIVLQRVFYWLNKNYCNKKTFVDDKYWVFKSVRNWQEQDFPFFSLGTVRRIFDYLVDELQLLECKTFNNDAMNQTKWYTINFKRLNELGTLINLEKEKLEKNDTLRCAKTTNAFAQNDKMHLPKMDKAFAQNDRMHLLNLSEPLPKSNTKSNTNIYNNISINQSNINNSEIKENDLIDEIDVELKNIENQLFKNIVFDELQEQYRDSAKDLINIILDVWYEYLSKSKKFRTIAGQEIAIGIVANRLLKINNLSMITTIDNLRKADIKTNFNNYALTTMYNAIATANIQLENKIEQDLNKSLENNKSSNSNDILNYNWLDDDRLS